MEKEALLEVRSLSVRYPGNKKEVLHQVDLTLDPGAITCVIGESGSGKSTLLQAILQLPGKVEITGGDISFRGQRLQTMPEAKRRAIRGSGMGVVFQEPGASLNPIRKIGRQFYDALHAHDRSITRAETQKRASAILKSMQFDDPERILDCCPLQLSGGMNQRVAIALAMGVVIGTVMVFCLRFFHSRGNKLTMTILIVFLAVGVSTMLDLSSLLVCMMVGATMINVSNDSPALLEQCDRFTPPLFLLFFVLSGASLDLSVLPTVGVVGIAYVLSRAIGKSLGATIGAAIEKCDKNIIRYLGMTLIPQAGVAIGMARMCLTDLPAYGSTINAVVLAGTLIYELTGPVITKIALTKAGEIKEGGAKPAAVTAAK